MATTAELKKRRDNARKEREQIQPLLDEVYQYAIPFRKSAQKTATGEKRVNQAFDHTAIDASFRFAGKFQQDFWPVGQQNFQLAPGATVQDQGSIEQLSKALAPISKIVQAFFADGSWDIAVHEMGIDLVAGTGAILMNSTTDPERLWDPISVSIDELLLEADASGRPSGIFWDRCLPLRAIVENWPDGKFEQQLLDMQKANPEQEIELKIDTVYIRAKAGEGAHWTMSVWCDKQEAIIYESRSRTCPWLTPRYFRVPGEVWGRGLAMLAMPSIKTANTAARLQLQAAAIAMLGIYTARDDGVFNPDLSPVAPGMFWKVSANSGALGPSVSRFPDPRLDLSGIVLQDLRSGVKQTMMDNDLPLDGEAVKSPTEILERVKKAQSDHIGAFGRLVMEITVPAVKRVVELAYDRQLISSELPIDQLLVKVQVKSPIAIARQAQHVQNLMSWLQMVIAITEAKAAAPGIDRIAYSDLMLSDAGRELGVDEKYIVPSDSRKNVDKQTAQAVAAAQVALLAKQAGGAGA